MLKKPTNKKNISKFRTAKKSRKYLYLKQALGMKEITVDQFMKLVVSTNKIIFDRSVNRKIALAKKLN